MFLVINCILFKVVYFSLNAATYVRKITFVGCTCDKLAKSSLPMKNSFICYWLCRSHWHEQHTQADLTCVQWDWGQHCHVADTRATAVCRMYWLTPNNPATLFCRTPALSFPVVQSLSRSVRCGILGADTDPVAGSMFTGVASSANLIVITWDTRSSEQESISE